MSGEKCVSACGKCAGNRLGIWDIGTWDSGNGHIGLRFVFFKGQKYIMKTTIFGELR